MDKKTNDEKGRAKYFYTNAENASMYDSLKPLGSYKTNDREM